MVALVVRRDGHNRSGAVAHEHIVGDPDGHALAVHGIDRVSTAEHARFVLGQIGPLEIALASGFFPVASEVGLLFRRSECVRERVLWGQHHVGAAEQRVWAGRENLQRAERRVLQLEQDFRAFAPADPRLLHPFGGVGPVDIFEVGEQAFGVGRDAQDPLAEIATLHGKPADLALAVDDFFVGEHGAQLGTPPDGAFVDVREAFGEELEEDPLGPAVILGVRRREFALPVIRKAEGFDLALEVDDVGCGVRCRVGACFYCVLFSR